MATRGSRRRDCTSYIEEFRIPTVEKREYVTEIPVNDNLKVKSWDSRYVNNIEKNTYRVQEKDIAA